MLAELILDFLPWPGRARQRDPGDDPLSKILGTVTVRPDAPGAIRDALNRSGWLAEEVIAAGDLRQGKEPSLVAMLTGVALIEALRPRRSRSLPRHFVLAVTRDRVVAFKAIGGGEEDGPYEVMIRPRERGSWPRDLVRMVDPPVGEKSTVGSLELAGERVPVWRPGSDTDSSTDDLLAFLFGRRP